MSIISKINVVSRELQIVINSSGIITEITSNCYDILGYTDVEMIDTNISKYSKYTFDKSVETKNFSDEISRKDGITLFFAISSTTLIDNENKTSHIHLSLIDISKYKEFKDREEMMFRMFERAKDIICSFEIIPEPKFTYLSHSVESILGYTVEEYLENPMLVFEIAHPDDYQIQLSKTNAKTDFSKLFQVRLRHKKGHYLWVEDYIIPTYNNNGQLVAIESITRNIQEKKELEQRLEKLGYHDNLTGLFSKNYLLKEMDMLNNKIHVPIAILVCDLDKLKYINDSLGHSTGDILIKNTAKLLLSTFNSNHIVVRTGGDEFVVIMMDISCHEANGLYAEFQLAIKLHNDSNKDMPIHISIGRAYSETSLNVMQHTLDIADSNMYKNKRQKNLYKNQSEGNIK
ncbi:sensor domain-containing diguanylate cyclase [Clostridium lacusfryxellense]|uniref:sensor domain-containing diguanylate cyclase n=1 Tax=Clostridium lacusfryxellense TaxID=205328 RepID=UPI001C0D3753|nr:GGDEF domain-containing protein [Clostridium lacusfryxellense]MBU3111664.1 diguanylate cyclase [Clostridium lacusfryxellense]